MAKVLERRFPDDQASRTAVTAVLEQACQEARTEEVRRALEEALAEAEA